MDNGALIDMSRGTDSKGKPFDRMNRICAGMIADLTSFARFNGKMNMDISELRTNLVPFPKLQFIVSSMSPLPGPSTPVCNAVAPSRQVDRMFASAFSRPNQLLKTDPMSGSFLACALLARGGVNLSDLNRNVERISNQIQMVDWNPDGFKVGHCSVPSLGQSHSLLALSNNSCIRSTFSDMEQRFVALYGSRRKAYTHHYTQYMDETHFDEVLETLRALQTEYGEQMSKAHTRPEILA
mmetsp:Transcript_11898/g.21887  ORF Transcript_11898/g.21887 Transcript_11898/m.21887 type:complete len:239 (+) Transcript_11898:2334-3050(+)